LSITNEESVMLTIQATCPMCDDQVVLQPVSVTLHLAAADSGNRYGFSCPDCDVFIVRPAGPTVVHALLAGDVTLATGEMAPWEQLDLAPALLLVESLPDPQGISCLHAEPLDEADFEMLQILLEDDELIADWLDEAHA
jgi:hypothetical protein